MCHEFTYRSADGHTRIHAAEWLPQKDVRAVVQISHGVAEYVMRYAPLARRLNEAGIAVVGNDHLGHGESVDGPRLYFGPTGSWKWLVEDLYQRRQLAGKRFPGVPYFLLGHSMGSFAARSYLIRYPGTVNGAILMGTGWESPAVLKAGRAAAILAGKRKGEQQPSPAMEKLVFGPYAKKFAPMRTPLDWLSANAENVDAYIADPLCGGTPSAGLFREMLGGMLFNQDSANLKKMNLNTPVLFLSGQDDPVGGMGKGVERTEQAFQRAGVRETELKLYPGWRHEILNETGGSQVADDLLAFIGAHL